MKGGEQKADAESDGRVRTERSSISCHRQILPGFPGKQESLCEPQCVRLRSSVVFTSLESIYNHRHAEVMGRDSVQTGDRGKLCFQIN